MTVDPAACSAQKAGLIGIGCLIKGEINRRERQSDVRTYKPVSFAWADRGGDGLNNIY